MMRWIAEYVLFERADSSAIQHLAALASVALTALDALTRIEPSAATVAACMANLIAGEEVAQGLIQG